jgi:hypothetical protein
MQINQSKNSITVIVPLEGIGLESKDTIDALIRDNIGNQTLSHSNIFLKFVSYGEPNSLSALNEYKEMHGLGDVEVLYTQDKSLGKLDFAVKMTTSKFYCFKTIVLGTVNDIIFPSNMQFLPDHLANAIMTITTDKSFYFVPFTELVDIDDFGKEEPNLIEIIDNSNFKFEYIKLDQIIFTSSLHFSFNEAIVKSQQGMMQFAPGMLVQKWMQDSKIPGSAAEIVTFREFISSDQVRQDLKIVVEGNMMKAV